MSTYSLRRQGGFTRSEPLREAICDWIEAIEQWCRENGYAELGSDVELDNAPSLAAHAALGFEPTLRLQFFRKRL